MKSNQRTARRSKRQVLLQKLEDRVLFSASPGNEILLDPSHVSGPQADLASKSMASEPAVEEFIFVDAGISNIEHLTDILRKQGHEHRRIVQLAANRDGLEQIADALAGRDNLKAIHILSHGDDATLKLGNSIVNHASLSGYSNALAQIGSALSPDGDILIYGCDLVSTDDGRQFMDAFSELTSSDVAASTNTTGSAAFGGDWQLESSTGQVQAQSVEASAWQGTLGEANITWVFGDTGAKVDFSSGSPVVSDTSATAIRDGFASWSDPATGELVLFTNGRDVWNGKTGRIVDNGSNLAASGNNAQPVAVIPIPGERDQFYVFVGIRFLDEMRVRYSIVDMSQGTEGAVTQKGILLTDSQEGMDVIPHANGSDYWFLTYGRSATHITIEARQFGDSGVVQTVTSDTALTFNASGYQDSYIVHTEDFTKLAMGQSLEGDLATADFDRATGLLSNPVLHLTGQDIGFKSAFSPDGTKLYFSVGSGGTSGTPHQYDLNTSTLTSLSTESGHGGPGLGPDGKIYFARLNQPTISYVNNPDLAGASANFVFQGLDLTGGGAFSGARSSSSISNTVAVQPTLKDGPLISLDAASYYSGRTIYLPLASTDVLSLATGSAFVSDPDSTELVSFHIQAAGIADGDAEIMSIGGRAFTLGTTASQVSDLIGGTNFLIAYDATTTLFTLSNNAGGNMSAADIQSLLTTVTYQHSSTTRTAAQRTFQFFVNDGAFNSNRATAYIPVGFQRVDTEDVGTIRSNPRMTALDTGGYVITWDSVLGDGESGGIVAQLFDASGIKIGTNFIANQFTDNNQRFPSVAGVAGGGFAIAFATATANDADTSTDATAIRYFDAAGNPVTGDITANTYTFGQQFDSDITTLDDGSIVVVWQSFQQDGDGRGIYGQRFTATGTKIGSEFHVSSTSLFDQEDPGVLALSDGGFVVAWEDIRADVTTSGQSSRGMFAQRFDATGNRVGDQIQLGEYVNDGQFDVSLARLTNGFAVMWGGIGAASGSSVREYFRIFDENGQPISGETVVGSVYTSGNGAAIVGLPDGGFYIVWEGAGAGGIVGQRFNANGLPVSDEIVLETDPDGVFEQPKIVQLASGNLALASINRDDEIFVRELPLGPPSVSIENLTTNPEYSNLVTYSSFDVPQRVDVGTDASLANLGSTALTGLHVTILNGDLNHDSISLENQGTGPGQISISGTDVRYEGVSIGSIDNTIPGFDDSRYEISFSSAPSQAAVEALLRATTFSSDSAGQNFAVRQIQFQLLDATGVATAATAKVAVAPRLQEFLVNTSYQIAEQANANVTKLTDGNYLVSWQDDTSEVDGTTVRGRIYSSLGIPVTQPFFLATLRRDGDQRNVSIASLDTGGFVATWQTTTDLDVDADDYAIAAQRFDSLGRSVGQEISVSVTETGAQSQPHVAALPGGQFAIVWEGRNVADSAGISLRLFDAAGAPTTSELPINTVTSGAQINARVSGLSNGNAVVVWQGANGNIVFRRFDAAGNALDASDVTANTTSGSQSQPSVVSYNGGFAIAWQGEGPSDTDGIFLRKFDDSGTGLGAEVLVNESTTGVQDLVNLVAAEQLVGVVWSGEGTTGSADSDGIWFRAFGQNGPAVSAETRINTTSTDTQRNPAVAVGNSFDEFFFAWESDHVTADNAGNEDTDGFGVFGRIANVSIEGAIDLDANDSSGATDLHYDTSYMQGDAPVIIADVDATVIPVNDAQYTRLDLLVGGVVDANNEFLHFGGQNLDLSSNVSTPQTVSVGGDTYAFTYLSGTGQLMIGLDGGSNMTVAQLESLLRDFEYSNTAAPPTESARTITWTADENGIATTSSTTTLDVFQLNATPTINVNATTAYTQGEAARVVDSTVSISDADDVNLESAVVTVSNVDIARDRLDLNAAAEAAAASAGITVLPYNIVNGQLRMSGTATLAEYESVLEGVRFYSLSAVLSDRTVDFVVNDGSSDSSAGVASITYSVDTTPPPTPTQPLDMLASSDTGQSDSDNITATNAPDFVIPIGTGTPGDLVTIFADGGILQTTTVLADGSAAFTPAAFADGTYQLTYSLTDIVGNESGLAPAIAVTIDTQNSSGSLFVTDEDFNTSTPRIRGASVTAAGEYLELEVNGITYSLNPGGTFFSFEVPAADALTDGTYEVTVTRHDLAGNSQFATGTITVDTVPPVIPTINALVTDTSTPTITGTATLDVGESLTVEVDGIVYMDSNPQLVVTGTTWSLTITNDIDPDGTYEVIAIVEDLAGNQSTDETVGELVVDTLEPSPPVVVPLDTTDTTPAVTGSAFLELGEFLEVTINGKTYSQALGEISFVGDDWTLVIPSGDALPEGRYDVMAVSSDGAGNSTSDATTDELGIDLTPPANPTVNSLTTSDSTPLLSGTANLASGESLTVSVNGRTYNVGSALLLSGTNWTLQIPNLFAFTTSGTYDVVAQITDAAGNTADDLTTGELIMDVVDPPVVNLLATNDSTPAITGTAILEPDETLTVEVNSVTYTAGDGNLSLSGSGWTLTIPTGSELPDGTYEVLARNTDSEGNFSNDTTTNELIIDTIAPAIPTVDALSTNDTTPRITGTATVGASETLRVSVDGHTYTEVDPELTRINANWTLQIPVGREITVNGTHEVAAVVSDLAGNESTDLTTGELIIDTMAPNIPTVDTLATNDPTPAITGIAALGVDETLLVEVNGTTYALGDGDLSIAGSVWTLVIPIGDSLADGTYDVSATASDASGNATPDGTLNELIIDSTPPAEPTINILTSNDATPFLTGTATLDSGDTLTVEINGVVYDDSQPHLTVAGTDWSLQVPAFGAIMADGVYEVIATITDLAGNQSTDSTIGEFTKDTVLPDAPVVDFTGTNQIRPSITGEATLAPDETLTVEVDSVVYTMGGGNLSISGSDWTLTIPVGNELAEGTYEVLASVTDSLGNQNVDGTTNELVVDLTPPAIPTVDTLTTNDSTPLLTGTAVLAAGDEILVRINGVTYNESGAELTVSSGNWSLQIPVLFEFTANGVYDVEVTITDLAGNVSTDATIGEFTYDTALPDAPVVTPLATNDSTPAISGTANLAPDETLAVAVNGVNYTVGDGNLSLTGSAWTLVIPSGNALTEGTYEVVATATDSLGNQNVDGTTNELVVDLTPPVVPTVDALTTNDATPFLTGTATMDPGEELVVRVNSVDYFEIDPHLTVAGSNWSLQIPLADQFTVDGVYDVEAIVTDLAGNVSTDVTIGEFTLDTGLPNQPTVDLLATNDTTPAVTGTANLQAGESLTVEIDGVTYAEGPNLTFAGAIWTLAIPTGSELVEGTYEVIATITDGSGNANSDATTDELVIDLTPPPVPTVDILSTNDSTPLLTGAATVTTGDDFRVQVNGQTYLESGPDLTLAGNNWSLQIPTTFQFTAVGSYEVAATVTDAAGNATTDGTTAEFTFDNNLPDAPVVDLLAINDTTPVITGSASLAPDETLTVEVNGITYTLGDGDLGITGATWTLAVPPANALPEGIYDVLATTTDSLGNANNDATTNELTIDLTPPQTPTVDFLTSNDPTPLLTGTAIVGPGEALDVFVNGVPYVEADPHLTRAGNIWSLQIPVGFEFTANGAYDIQATVTDLAGNASGDVTIGEFTYDTILPDAPVVDALATNDVTPTITGTANLAAGDALTVQIGGVTYSVGDGNLSLAGNIWSLTIPGGNSLTEGIYEVLAITTDAVGNANNDATTNELNVDLTPPITPTVDALSSSDSTPLITGTAVVGTGEALVVRVNGVTYLESSTELARAGNNWSLQISAANQFTADGTYDVEATVTDLAGNASSDVTLGEFTYDTALPDAPVVNPQFANDTTPNITGTVNLAGDESLSVEVNGVVYHPIGGRLTISGNDWNLAIPGVNALSEGTYDVTATVTDSLGNTANDSTNGELTIDRTPPVTPTVDFLASNDSTPLLTGTATLGAGEFLNVSVNGNTYVDGDGSLTVGGSVWSLQVPLANEFVANGTYNVVATATDAAGNVSTDLTSGEFEYDIVLPDAPTVNLLTTNDRTPSVTGTAVLAGGESLTVEVNGVIYTPGDTHLTMVGSDWSLLIPPANILSEGIYDVSAVATDAVGNSNNDATTNELVIDLTPPVVPSASQLASNDSTPQLTGTAVVGVDEILTVTVNGRTYIVGDGNLTLAGNNWALQIPSGDAFATDGVYDVTVTTTDAAGNSSSDPTSGEFTFDTQPPGVPTVNGLVTNDVTPTVTGTAVLGIDETLTVRVNGQTYVLGDGFLAIAGSNWSLAIPGVGALSEGTYDVVATATDAVGNSAVDVTADELVVDLTAPATPTVNTLVANDPTPLLTGTATLGPGETLAVDFNGRSYSVGDGNLTFIGNTWSLQIPSGDALVSDGTYDVVATASDAAGNSSIDVTSSEYTFDTALPDLPTVNPQAANDTTPNITGTVNLAPDESLSVEVNGVVYHPIGGRLTVSGNTWNLAIPGANALAEGIYDVTATVTDSLGNQAVDLTNSELTIDRTPPATPTVDLLTSNDSTPLLSGTAVLGPGETLTVAANGITYVSGDGNLSLSGSTWSLQIPTAQEFLVDGTYDIVATATDAAGNVATDVTNGEFVLDTVPPAAPTVNALITNDVTPAITGTAVLAGDELLTVSVNGVAHALGAGNLSITGSDWTLLIPAADALPEGIYDVSATTTDSLGNANSDVTSDELVIDVTPPAVPSADVIASNNATPQLTGTATLGPGESLTVTVAGQSYSVGDGNLVLTGTSWSLQIPPSNAFTTDGVYDVTATVTDAAGNSTDDPSSGEFTYDTTPPSAPTVNGLLTNNTTPAITGTATLDVNESLSVVVDGQAYNLGGGQLSIVGSNWSLAIPAANALSEGPYNVIATAYDAVGNSASDGTIDELVIDLTPPAIPTVNTIVSNDPTPLLSGTAVLGVGETLTVSFDGSTYALGDGNLSLQGNTWLLDIPTPQQLTTDGTYDVVATATDAAGNSATDITSGEYTLDSSLPDAAIVNFLSTNNTTPTITGTVNLALGDSLAITIDGQTYVPGDGHLVVVGSDWSLTIPPSNVLVESVYDVVATTTNALGSTNTDATVNELDIDLTPPSAPTTDFLIANDSTPMLTGTIAVEPGGTMSVSANGVVYTEGDGSLSRVGTVWTLQVPTANAFPADGTYDIVATSTDAAGNASSDSTTGEFTLDTVLPDPPTVNALTTNDVTPTITGNANLLADETLAVALNGTVYNQGDGNLSVSGTNWALTVPFANALFDSTFEVVATATDSLGNANSDTTSNELTIDLTPPPTPTVDQLTSNDRTPLLTGTATLVPGDTLTVTLNGSTYTMGDGNLSLAGTTWALQVPLANQIIADGTYDVTAVAADSFGNSATDSTSGEFTLDTVPPATPTVSFLETNDVTPAISGTATMLADETLDVQVNGITYAQGDGNLAVSGTGTSKNWTLQIPVANGLPEAIYDVLATTTDSLGNAASDTSVNEVVIDLTPPAFTPIVNSLVDNEPAPLLTGSVSLASGETFTVVANGDTYSPGDGSLSIAGTTWTLQIPVANGYSADGTYDITASIQDIAGNVSTDTTVGEYTLDTVLPMAPTVDPLTTNNTSPLLSGTAVLAADETLTVVVNGRVYSVGDGQLSMTGIHWSLSISVAHALTEGIYDVNAMVVDSLGNANTDGSLDELTIDLTAPSIPTVNSTASNSGTPLISGTAILGPGEFLSVTAGGVTYLEGDGHLSMSGANWLLQIPVANAFVADGAYDITATVIDAAGNSSTDTTTGEFVLDSTLPSTATVDLIEVNSTTPTITGSAILLADESLTITVHGVTYTPGDGQLTLNGASWSLVIPVSNALPEGTYDVVATVTDSLGNSSQDATIAEVVVDLTPPTAPTVDSLITNDSTPTITGTATLLAGERLTVQVNGGIFTDGDGNLSITAAGNWSLLLPGSNALTADGPHNVLATVTDAAGNATSDSTIDEVLLDTLPPARPSINALITNDTTPAVDGTAVLNPGDSLEVTLDGRTYTVGDGNLSAANGTWTLTVPASRSLAEGVYQVTATAADSLGNAISDTQSNELTIDLTPPSAPTVDPLATDDSTPAITGNAPLAPGDTLTVTVNGRTYTVGDGNLTMVGPAWILQLPVDGAFTTGGPQDIIATITDSAGNATSDGTTNEIFLTIQPPIQPTVQPISTTDATPLITGTVSLAAGETFSVQVNGTTYIPGDGQLSLNGSIWTLQIPSAAALALGSYDVVASVTDAIGNLAIDPTIDEVSINATTGIGTTLPMFAFDSINDFANLGNQRERVSFSSIGDDIPLSLLAHQQLYPRIDQAEFRSIDTRVTSLAFAQNKGTVYGADQYDGGATTFWTYPFNERMGSVNRRIDVPAFRLNQLHPSKRFFNPAIRPQSYFFKISTVEQVAKPVTLKQLHSLNMSPLQMGIDTLPSF